MVRQLTASWKAQINILWLGQAILMAMLAMSLPYWPLYISQLGQYSREEVRFWSAAIYMAPFISSIFSSPLWGRLGDKYGYKSMVIRACLGLFITQTFILFCSSVELIFLFRLLQGVLAGFIVSAQAWALDITPDTQRGATIGKLQSATAVGNLMGPLMGGIIATYGGGYRAIFTSSSIICALITMMFLCLLQKTMKKNAATISDKPSRISLSALTVAQKSILSILLIIIIVQLARAMVTPVFSLFVTEQLGGNDMTVGVLYAATGLMIFITAPWWGTFFDKIIGRDQQAYTIVSVLLFISAALQVMHAYADSTTSILILRLLWGICLGALLPVLLRLLVDNAHDNENGLFLGFGNSATKLGNLLGIILGALIEVNFGYANSFLATALLYVIAGIVILFQFKPLKAKKMEISHE